MSERDYYCNLKFRFLKIDLVSDNIYTCHAAKPHTIDYDWLNKHPGQLFNNQINVEERKMMLQNIRNPSCEQNCWPSEDKGAISPRLFQNGPQKTHKLIKLQPEIVDLTINAECNLTCVYCCKEFSTAWTKDIINNGNYNFNNNSNRHHSNENDHKKLATKQKELKQTDKYKLLLDEFNIISGNIQKLIITGGEPFLDNTLVNLLTKINITSKTKVIIYSGLGVRNVRFFDIMNKIKSLDHLDIHLYISAETTGKLLEFTRYGVIWEEFSEKINFLTRNNFNIHFHCTITNLTAFGFVKFYKSYSYVNMHVTFAYVPDMMAPYVLDETSKAHILSELNDVPDDFKNKITKSILPNPSNTQREDIRTFLTEFTKRRLDINVNVFPDSFLRWVELK